MWKWAVFSVVLLAAVWVVRAAEDPPAAPSSEVVAPRGGEAREPAAAPQNMTTSRIVHVTVYPNSALVTREVDVPEGAGAAELIVTPLPVQTVNSSLYSEGSDGIRVLTTRFRTRPVKEDTREEVRKLQEQLKQLQVTVQKIESDLKTAEQNLQMVAKLEVFTTANTQHTTEKGTLNAETIIALSKHVMDQRAEKAKEMVSLMQQKQDKQEEMEYVNRQLRDLTAGQSKTERDAVIIIDKANKAAGKVRLNYLVDAAVWRPQYKLRAGKDEKEAIQVEYLAAILQQTGEDWNNVNLTLSTAQPMLNAAPPDLRILEVSVMPRGGNFDITASIPNPPGGAGQPGPMGNSMNPGGNRTGVNLRSAGAAGGVQPPLEQQKLALQLDNQAKMLRQQAVTEYNSKQEAFGGQLVNDAAMLEQANELLNGDDRVAQKGKNPMVTAKPSGRDGPSVSYHLKARLSVPSRHDEQILEVTRIDMAPEYFYKAVPVLTQQVYRLANLTNKSDYVLLPGEATMYQGTDFVGRMNLPLVAIGEQFTAGFGADPQLQVQRQMVEKSRTMQGGNQVLKYEYRILLSSYKDQPIALQLWDRLPFAEDQTVGVTLTKATPEISKDPIYEHELRPRNLLRWDLKIDPTMTGEKALTVQYDFKVELDKQMSINAIATR